MTNQKEKMVNVIVCCGGTGSKIAANLAELMGQDPYWRHEMDTRTYFLLIDTDSGDMNKYGGRIRKAAPDVPIEYVPTTEGFNTPGEMLSEFIRPIEAISDSIDKKAALKRFAEHWWCENPSGETVGDLRPFGMPGMRRSIQEGAGQVPMVSFLATWLSMRGNSRKQTGIEETFERLAREINIRFGSTPEMFNVYLLGSLAGGTGRGSLIPIAYKIKETFYRVFNTLPVIDAYLLHASCFRFEERDKRVATMINAMSGWSEISAWMDKPDPKAPTFYSLPSVAGIQDSSLDVLSTHTSGTDRYERQRLGYPIDQLYVIGPTNQNGYTVNLSSGDEIYSMLGASLYVKLTQTSIKSDQNNSSRDFASVGSSIAEIPSHDLDHYFQMKARVDAISALVSTGYVDQLQRSRDQETCNREIALLLERVGLATAWKQVSSATPPAARETAVDRLVLDEVEPRFKAILGPLTALLEAQAAPEDVEEALRKIAKRNSFADTQLQGELARAYESALLDHFRVSHHADLNSTSDLVQKLVGDAVERLLPLSAKESTSLSHAALELIRGTLDRLMAELEILRESAQQLPKVSPELSEELERTSKREGFLGLVGAYYSKDEMDGIVILVRKHLSYHFARALAEGLSAKGGLLFMLKEHAKKIMKRCQVSEDALKRLSAKEEYKPDFIVKMAEKLFSSEHTLESALGMEGMVGLSNQNIRRAIRPLHPREDELKLSSSGVRELLTQILERGEDAGNASLNSDYLANEFERALVASHYQIRKQRVDRQAGLVKEAWENVRGAFSLSDTLRDLSRVWAAYLERECAVSEDRRMALLQKFRFFFGTTPEVSDGHVSVINSELMGVASEDGLLLSLAAATIRSCAAFWSVDSPEKRRYTVLIPKDMSKDKESWTRYLQDSAGVAGTIDIVSVSHVYNPCLLAVYTENSVDSWEKIRTLDDWRNDPSVARVLALSEVAKPAHPFNPEIKNIWSDYRGSGFTEPRYVLNPACRVSRWRPWVPAEEREKELLAYRQQMSNDGVVQAKAALPLMYAIFGPEAFMSWALGYDRGQIAVAALEAFSRGRAKGPILVEGKGKQWSVGRYAVVFLDGRVDSNHDQGFTPAGGRLQSGVASLKQMLDGEVEALSGEIGKRREMAHKLRAAIVREYESFETVVASQHGFSIRDARQYQQMMLGLQDAIGVRIADADSSGDRDELRFWLEASESINRVLGN